MPKIHVNKPFRLLDDKSQARHFGVGVHEVSDYEAKHWFVQAHSEPLSEAVAVPDPPPAEPPGGPDSDNPKGKK